MEEKVKRCQFCGRELYDEKHCIFHSEKPDKDAELFQEKLYQIFEDKSLQNYDFSEFIFPPKISFPKRVDKKIIFRKAIFQGITSFEESTFQDLVDFRGANFKGVADFSGVIFQEVARFTRTDFKGGSLFSGATFESVTFFNRSNFQDRVGFVRATFKGETIFSETVFKGVADFTGAVFQNNPLFEKVTFDGESVFMGATFQGVPSFWGATFQDSVDFHKATFNASVKFWETVFQKEAIFRETVFKQATMFLEVKSQEEVHFVHAVFEDALIVKEGSNNKIFAKEEVDFRYVSFLKPEKVSFRKVDLSKFRFLGTDLRKVEFVDVDWDRKGGRNRIYDETEPDPDTEKLDYPLIVQVYKRLRANYEDNLNYAEAGDFHIGEMEMRRKGEKNIFNKGIIWLYKLISNYGESYWRPLVFWILPILIIFPMLFMYAGIQEIPQSQSSYLIDYDFDASSILPNKEKVDDYLKSFVYSLSVFSLVREKIYRPINNWGHFWMVLESILSPVLIAFFLLALRRRFRR